MGGKSFVWRMVAKVCWYFASILALSACVNMLHCWVPCLFSAQNNLVLYAFVGVCLCLSLSFLSLSVFKWVCVAAILHPAIFVVFVVDVCVCSSGTSWECRLGVLIQFVETVEAFRRWDDRTWTVYFRLEAMSAWEKCPNELPCLCPLMPQLPMPSPSPPPVICNRRC